jgi:hypothetical protein
VLLLAVIVASLLAWWAWGRIFSIAAQPRVLRRAQQGRGTLDVLVVDDGPLGPSDGARPALLQPGADVGRRMIVRVLPDDSPRRDAEAAGRHLCRYAEAVGTPAAGAAVPFGTSNAAVRRFAIGGDYDVVLPLGNESRTEVGCNPAASRRLAVAK